MGRGAGINNTGELNVTRLLRGDEVVAGTPEWIRASQFVEVPMPDACSTTIRDLDPAEFPPGTRVQLIGLDIELAHAGLQLLVGTLGTVAEYNGKSFFSTHRLPVKWDTGALILLMRFDMIIPVTTIDTEPGLI
jgi:hypothetical protein